MCTTFKRATILIFLGGAITCQSNAQANMNLSWTWISGDSMANAYSVYGTKGIPGVNNKPGARIESASWKDASGNFWLFGGFGYAGTTSVDAGYLYDLWKYDPLINQWTWINGDSTLNNYADYGTKGIPSVTNHPGSRGKMNYWKDASGNFWIFGGLGFTMPAEGGPGLLSDVWKYDPLINQWTWIKGNNTQNDPGVYGTQGASSNLNNPGSRETSVSWRDAFGNFWLFGGNGYDTYRVGGELNDLWKYDPVANIWTWMKGNNTADVAGVYGTKGTPAASNNPGGREEATSWVDKDNKFWLFGGGGTVPANSSDGILNDLWKYDPAINQWTCIKGDNTLFALADYGTQGIASNSNDPGARVLCERWIDTSNNLWLFGGSPIGGAYLNDLWKYDISVNQWTWIKGDSLHDLAGIYGTQGIAALTNRIPARYRNTSWLDTQNNIWIFGGAGISASGQGYLNDLWRLEPVSVAPVTLSEFSAQIVQQDVWLKWLTAQEINCSHFIIERSADGLNFHEVGNRMASGNNAGIKQYLFKDESPLKNSCFYRLKIIDTDGKFSYSKIVSVKINEDSFIQLFPNPAKNILYVRLKEKNVDGILQIEDISGRTIWKAPFKINNKTLPVNIKDLPNGSYYLLIKNEANVLIKSFVKE